MMQASPSQVAKKFLAAHSNRSKKLIEEFLSPDKSMDYEVVDNHVYIISKARKFHQTLLSNLIEACNGMKELSNSSDSQSYFQTFASYIDETIVEGYMPIFMMLYEDFIAYSQTLRAKLCNDEDDDDNVDVKISMQLHDLEEESQSWYLLMRQSILDLTYLFKASNEVSEKHSMQFISQYIQSMLRFIDSVLSQSLQSQLRKLWSFIWKEYETHVSPLWTQSNATTQQIATIQSLMTNMNSKLITSFSSFIGEIKMALEIYFTIIDNRPPTHEVDASLDSRFLLCQVSQYNFVSEIILYFASSFHQTYHQTKFVDRQDGLGDGGIFFVSELVAKMFDKTTLTIEAMGKACEILEEMQLSRLPNAHKKEYIDFSVSIVLHCFNCIDVIAKLFDDRTH